jgi:tetratricopeptide (TPR) repeat protein
MRLTKVKHRMVRPAIFAFVLIYGLFEASPALANIAKANQLLKNGNGGAAAPLFFNVYQSARGRSEKMQAEWGLAQSLQRAGLLYSASKYYSIIVRRGKSASNPYFRQALEQLGVINSVVSLGESHIVQLFKTKISPSDIPGPARGFYFYYQGVEAFGQRKLEKARGFFDKVPTGSSYYLGAEFHLGVIANLSGRHSQAIGHLQKVIAGTRGSNRQREMHEQALMNIARIHYETKRYSDAVGFYGRVPRDSDHWLDAIWETAWAFYMMEKFNNSLGQIHTLHSPFFVNRFYPESFILQSITFLRMCRYDQVKESMKRFRDRYAPVFGEIKSMLSRFQGNPKDFFRLVYSYKAGELRQFKNAEEIIKKLSLLDSFKGTVDIIRISDRESNRLSGFRGSWNGGLYSSLNDFLRSKKSSAISRSGRDMLLQASRYYSVLLDLSNQTKFIVAEMQLGKLEKLRSKISVSKADEKVQFIGGMQKLNIGESLEYWPFEQEYWEDELGFYVYNMASKCAVVKE